MIAPPKLWLVIPCYNEAAVLPRTAPAFLSKLDSLITRGEISSKSRICFVDDGSTDNTWEIISLLAEGDPRFIGMSLTRNRGHQNALLCGLLEARTHCDAAISIDCDGQDDINAIDEMVDKYKQGYEIVYGVRSSRETDTPFKRKTAESFYRIMSKLGAEVVFNHADYRLMSSDALNDLASFSEINLFLRGLIPLIGRPSSTVEYERRERAAGKSHYPLSKMIHLAVDGVTSLSTKPIHLISIAGITFGCIGILGLVWALLTFLAGNSVPGWTSSVCVICLIGGLQLFSLGIVGEYVGKIYLEVKRRPRYLIEKRAGIQNIDEASEPSNVFTGPKTS